MTKTALYVFTSAAALVLAGHAYASSSPWQKMEGGRVRLITSGVADGAGEVRGALEIDLLPGWKTYWRDPGDAGVPPSLDVSGSPNIAAAALEFPAPGWHDDGVTMWAGYEAPVAFPVRFQLRDPQGPATIDAKVFLGVCERICVPVDATFRVDPANDPDNRADAIRVSAAEAALPPSSSANFGLKLQRRVGADLFLEATFPGSPASAQLFITGSQGYVLSVPKRLQESGKTVFMVTALEAPTAAPKGGLDYTLATDAGAVSGLLPYP